MGDSALINLTDNKIEKIISFKTGNNFFVIGGKHLGKQGKAEKIDEKRKLAEIKTKEEKINVNLGNLMAI